MAQVTLFQIAGFAFVLLYGISIAIAQTPKPSAAPSELAKCYNCSKNCSADWTSPKIATCKQGDICSRLFISIKSGNLTTVERSMSCTPKCEIGGIASPTYNFSVTCCSNYQDTKCDIKKYYATIDMDNGANQKLHASLVISAIATVAAFIVLFRK